MRIQRIERNLTSNCPIINYCQIWSTNGKYDLRRVTIFRFTSIAEDERKVDIARQSTKKMSDGLLWRAIGNGGERKGRAFSGLHVLTSIYGL